MVHLFKKNSVFILLVILLVSCTESNYDITVYQTSESGDPKVAASYSVVVGQIHSDQGHKNEPLKIFYKKFPGHTKGSVFWNYEINTQGDNSKRWDYSQAIWGYDMSVVADQNNQLPSEPVDGIELGESFNYAIEVKEGIMTLTFTSDGHETEQATGYKGELQFFKAGAYNQSNGKDPVKNNVWNTGSNSFDGNIEKQYNNGDYAEVWFKSIKLD
ncbi:MAG: polysaccharide lyase family 7 protein [Flavobacteriaceae bacterium]